MTTPLHARTHPGLDQHGCFGCKAAGLRFTLSQVTSAANARERELRRDIDAYRRLRSDGLQPKSYRGAARLERRADTAWGVEQGGRDLPDGKVREAADWARAQVAT